MALIHSERNTPALFGAGIIDRIPDRVLHEIARGQASATVAPVNAEENGERVSSRGSRLIDEIPVSGRVSVLKDGKIGAFWLEEQCRHW